MHFLPSISWVQITFASGWDRNKYKNGWKRNTRLDRTEIQYWIEKKYKIGSKWSTRRQPRWTTSLLNWVALTISSTFSTQINRTLRRRQTPVYFCQVGDNNNFCQCKFGHATVGQDNVAKLVMVMSVNIMLVRIKLVLKYWSGWNWQSWSWPRCRRKEGKSGVALLPFCCFCFSFCRLL